MLRKAGPGSDTATIGNHLPASDLHHELVRGVFNNMVRMHGIATDTLVFDLFPLRRLSGEKEMHVQLNMLKWSEELLCQAPMLQHQMQLELERYASPTKISTFVVAWRFAPACLIEASRLNEKKQQVQSQSQMPSVGTPAVLERRRGPRALPKPGLHASLFVPDQSAVSFAATEFSPIE